MDKIKWLICGSYKPPSLNNNIFQENCDLTLDKAFNKYDNIMIIGDLNFNMLEKTNSQCLYNVCDIFGLDNIIDTPTCFPSNSKPTLLDVILTNKKDLTCKTCNFNCGLSDVHNFISVQFKQETPSVNAKYCTYRSFKKFDIDNFNDELNHNLSTKLDLNEKDVNTMYDNFSEIFLDTANKHAPVKKKPVLQKPVPFMNKTLKQAIFKKRML